jgi:prepilin-type N-terminal cleavage/methylation domain-containing protein
MKKQSGFTLLELTIALAIIIVFMGAMASAVGPWIDFRQKMITDARLKLLDLTVHRVYMENSGVADWSGDGALLINSKWTVNGIIPNGNDPYLMGQSSVSDCNMKPDGIEGQMTTTKNNLRALLPYATEGLDTLSMDGFNRPICVLISNYMERPVPSDFESGATTSGGSTTYNTPTIPHHRIVFLSAGPDGEFDPATTFDPATGDLQLNGDDQGVMVDGYTIQMEVYLETWKKLTKAVKSYEKYAKTQYKLNANRDLTTDYFYSGKTVDPETGVVTERDQNGAFRSDVNNDIPLLAPVGDSGSPVPTGLELMPHQYQTVSNQDPSKNALSAQTAMEALGLTETDTLLPAKPMMHTHIRMYNIQPNSDFSVPQGVNPYIRYPANTDAASPCAMSDKDCRQFPIYSAMIQANVPSGGVKKQQITDQDFRTIQMPAIGVFN